MFENTEDHLVYGTDVPSPVMNLRLKRAGFGFVCSLIKSSC